MRPWHTGVHLLMIFSDCCRYSRFDALTPDFECLFSLGKEFIAARAAPDNLKDLVREVDNMGSAILTSISRDAPRPCSLVDLIPFHLGHFFASLPS